MGGPSSSGLAPTITQIMSGHRAMYVRSTSEGTGSLAGWEW